MKKKLTTACSVAVAGAEPAACGLKPRYVLRLYVTGMTPRSTRAIANAKAICETHLAGRYDLRVVDVYQEPSLICGDGVIALPMLVKESPPPVRRIIGDLADADGTLVALDLKRRSRHAKRL